MSSRSRHRDGAPEAAPHTHPTFSFGRSRRATKTYELMGLEEEIAWRNDFRPYLALSPNLMAVAAHGFTEIVNNAVDHSGGTHVGVSAWQEEEALTMSVQDDGVGIFERIALALGLTDRRMAPLEPSKGKLTTDPTRHSGEGVFFTSRIFNHFQIEANGLNYGRDELDGLGRLLSEDSEQAPGTTVIMSTPLNNTRTTAEVFQVYMDAPEDFDFSKTTVPIRLALIGDDRLISRSQAKRVVAGLGSFKSVVPDFRGVDEVGQAFSDELFRVYRLTNPGTELSPVNMSRQVQGMWMRAVAPRR